MSTPSNSSGKCRGKSTRENLVWSGRAKQRGGCILGDRISTSTLVFDGTGTGALSKRNIHVSISRMSWSTIDEAPSKLKPVNTVHKDSLWRRELNYNYPLIRRERIIEYRTWYSVVMLHIDEELLFRCRRQWASLKQIGTLETLWKMDDVRWYREKSAKDSSSSVKEKR